MDADIIYQGFDRVWKLIEANEIKRQQAQEKSDREFERVWKLFEKTDAEIEANEAKRLQAQEKSDREFERVWKLFEKTETEIEQLKYSYQETRTLMDELVEQSKETDRQMQETDRRMQETDRQIKRVSQEIGRLGGRWGEFIESMVKPAVVRLFQQRGLKVHEVHPNVTSKRNGVAAEIDLLVTNDEHCVAVEVKSFLSVDDVKEHKERLEKFKMLFPRYADAKLYGAVAGAVIPDDVARYAYHQGFFVLGQKGENIEVWNDASFEPKIY